MALRQVIEVIDVVGTAAASGAAVQQLFTSRGCGDGDVAVRHVKEGTGETDFVRVFIPGRTGKTSGKGGAPTLSIVGRLGGVGARPARLGMVSDADGCVAALAAALKLWEMHRDGDVLAGDVVVTTHVCPNAPVLPHTPVPFMDCPVDMATLNRLEVPPDADAVLSIDTTKGNRVINQRGFAISPTVRDGYILRVSEKLLDIMQWVSGRLPAVFPVTTQDITPYGNGLHHLNSILQPACATAAPVVGVAITAESAVPGCATGASHETDIAEAARFCVEVAKAFSAGEASGLFCDEQEFRRIVALYGSMTHLKTLGKVTA